MGRTEIPELATLPALLFPRTAARRIGDHHDTCPPLISEHPNAVDSRGCFRHVTLSLGHLRNISLTITKLFVYIPASWMVHWRSALAVLMLRLNAGDVTFLQEAFDVL
jgi:hypothetical protein